jgi:hypothetical protein
MGDPSEPSLESLSDPDQKTLIQKSHPQSCLNQPELALLNACLSPFFNFVPSFLLAELYLSINPAKVTKTRSANGPGLLVSFMVLCLLHGQACPESTRKSSGFISH